MKKEIQELKRNVIDSKIQILNMKKITKDWKIKKKLDGKVEEMKLKINNLIALEERIIKKFDIIDVAFKRIQFINNEI